MPLPEFPEFEHVAAHEAGHVVIGSVLGLVLDRVTIVAEPDAHGRTTWLDTVTEPRLARYEHARINNHYLQARLIQQATHHAEIMMSFASLYAELELLGKAWSPGWDGDYSNIEGVQSMCLIEPDPYKLAGHSARLVHKHRGLIRCIGRLLLKHGTLTGDQVREWISADPLA